MPFLATKQTPLPDQDLLTWMFDNPQYDLDNKIYIDAADPSRSITGREGRSLIRQVATGLRRHGLQPGDCVVVGSFNNIYLPVITLGIIAAGGVYSGFNPAYTSFEISHHLKVIHAKFIIAEPDLLKIIQEAKHEVPKDRIFIFDNIGQPIPNGFQGWKGLLGHGESDWLRLDPDSGKNTVCMLMFSSGTTGLPKAVRLTHGNFIAEHTLVFDNPPKPYPISRVVAMPMFHLGALPISMIAPFRQGATTYVMRRFEVEPYLKYHEKYSITEMLLVPPMVVSIIMSPLRKKYSLKSVRLAMCGAAPLGKGPQSRFQALLAPDAPFCQVWGMTETTSIATMFPWPENDDTGSIGRPLCNLDTKLVDDDGNDISQPNTRGELCIRGPTVTLGYFENPEANERDFDEAGFFHTGDIAFVDEKTNLWYIVDRKKELIKVRGFQVAPPEIEAILLSHPSIVDAAVIGIPAPSDSRDGELPRAYVVQRPGTAKLTEQEVIQWAGKKLATYKRLEGGVRFMEAIPKTASGKILKRVLREQVSRELQIGPKL